MTVQVASLRTVGRPSAFIQFAIRGVCSEKAQQAEVKSHELLEVRLVWRVFGSSAVHIAGATDALCLIITQKAESWKQSTPSRLTAGFQPHHPLSETQSTTSRVKDTQDGEIDRR